MPSEYWSPQRRLSFHRRGPALSLSDSEYSGVTGDKPSSDSDDFREPAKKRLSVNRSSSRRFDRKSSARSPLIENNIFMDISSIGRYYIQVLVPSSYNFFDFGKDDDSHNATMDRAYRKSEVYRTNSRRFTRVDWSTKFTKPDRSNSNKSIIIHANHINPIKIGLNQLINFVSCNSHWQNLSNETRHYNDYQSKDRERGQISLKFIGSNLANIRWSGIVKNHMKARSNHYDFSYFEPEIFIRSNGGHGPEFHIFELISSPKVLHKFNVELFGIAAFRSIIVGDSSSEVCQPLDFSKIDVRDFRGGKRNGFFLKRTK